MVENSKIEWTDHTFSPWLGCTKVSPACDNCYAEEWAKRFGKGELWQGTLRRTSPSNWSDPHRWNRKAAAAGKRERVFCASLSDVFDNAAPTDWRNDLWEVIRATPHLDWLLLTKRPQNIGKMLPRDWGTKGYTNVWLGTSVENQVEAARRIPILMDVPARVRFLSCEPLLGPVHLRFAHDEETGECIKGGWPMFGAEPTGKLHWVITGGESGPNARPSNPEWFRDLRDQCAAAGVPFLHKQNGEFASVSEVEGAGEHFTFEDGRTVRRVGKKRAGRLLDGVEHNGVPT